MSTFNFLVTVETERDSGLIASRDDQAEIIVQEIDEAVSNASISGIGARSDSDYSVSSVSIDVLDKVSMREVNKEYEDAVKAEERSDAQLRRELKVARQDIAAKDRRIVDLENKLAKKAADAKKDATRVYMGGAYDESARTYLPDGVHDNVYFSCGERDDDILGVSFDREGALEIRSSSGVLYPAVMPISGNVFRVVMIPRF